MALTSTDEGGYLEMLPEVGAADVAAAEAELVAMQAQLDKAMNIRLKPELHAECLAAAKRDGLQKSVWAREVLTAVLNSRLPLAEVVLALGRQAAEPPVQVFVRGARPSLGMSVVDPSTCLHPRHLRAVFETLERCACGKQFGLASPAGGESAPE